MVKHFGKSTFELGWSNMCLRVFFCFAAIVTLWRSDQELQQSPKMYSPFQVFICSVYASVQFLLLEKSNKYKTIDLW